MQYPSGARTGKLSPMGNPTNVISIPTRFGIRIPASPANPTAVFMTHEGLTRILGSSLIIDDINYKVRGVESIPSGCRPNGPRPSQALWLPLSTITLLSTPFPCRSVVSMTVGFASTLRPTSRVLLLGKLFIQDLPRVWLLQRWRIQVKLWKCLQSLAQVLFSGALGLYGLNAG